MKQLLRKAAPRFQEPDLGATFCHRLETHSAVTVSFSLVKSAVDGVPRLVNVPESAHLQADMSSFIGTAGDVPAGIIQKSKS